jgi:DNA-directed RNA polymerase specialized sigma subunit
MASIWRKEPFDQGDTLLEPHLASHFQNWKQNPGPETSSALLQAVQPVLGEALRTYAGASAGSPSMMGKAKVMALQAFETYDPSRARLRTHLLSRLQGLRRHAARSEALVRVPEGSALAWNRLRQESERMRDELGREPSTAELSGVTGLSTKRIDHLRRNSMPAVTEGQVTRADTEGAGVWTPPVKSGPSSKTAHGIWAQVVYDESDPVDQVILERTLGLHGKKPLSNLEIAKAVRLSPGAVSQRRLKIQQRLDLAGDVGLIPG